MPYQTWTKAKDKSLVLLLASVEMFWYLMDGRAGRQVAGRLNISVSGLVGLF
jgi:predicted nucleic acid-binding protein